MVCREGIRLGKKISSAVIRRMPRYYRQLTELDKEGVERISSEMLASRMGLTASQVRQDFNCFGGFGQQGYGYNVQTLRKSIGVILHIDKGHTAVLIGVGNLGRALLRNFHFSKYGFEVTGAFDPSPAQIGRVIGEVKVRPLDELEEFVRQKRPDIAILTVPGGAARETAQQLVSWGVRGIWNFTNIDLHLELDDVPVENVHFSESLMVLSYRL